MFISTLTVVISRGEKGFEAHDCLFLFTMLTKHYKMTVEMFERKKGVGYNVAVVGGVVFSCVGSDISWLVFKICVRLRVCGP